MQTQWQFLVLITLLYLLIQHIFTMPKNAIKNLIKFYIMLHNFCRFFVFSPIVDQLVSSTPMRALKEMQHWSWSALGWVVSLDWSAKSSKLWWLAILVNLYQLRMLDFTHRSFGYQNRGSDPFRGGSKLCWHVSDHH